MDKHELEETLTMLCLDAMTARLEYDRLIDLRSRVIGVYTIGRDDLLNIKAALATHIENLAREAEAKWREQVAQVTNRIWEGLAREWNVPEEYWQPGEKYPDLKENR